MPPRPSSSRILYRLIPWIARIIPCVIDCGAGGKGEAHVRGRGARSEGQQGGLPARGGAAARRPARGAARGDGGGKGDVVNTLREGFDRGGVGGWGLSAPSEGEDGRPPMWRFWRRVPARGKMGVFLGSWYTAPIVERAWRLNRKADLDQAVE